MSPVVDKETENVFFLFSLCVLLAGSFVYAYVWHASYYKCGGKIKHWIARAPFRKFHFKYNII